MKEIRIIAIGRGANSREAALTEEYLIGATRIGRSHGISPVSLYEIDERKFKDKTRQASEIGAVLAGEAFWLLDERGEMMSSPDFAQALQEEMIEARARLNIIIGGADGVDAKLRIDARRVIGLGRMVWPHMLARIMLGEQIYRALNIMANTPYHRGG